MTNETHRLAAFSDATRRRIFEIISVRPSSVADIARRLPVTRPAVSQHLRVLKDAGLVTVRTEGTRNIYQLNPKGMIALRDYMDSLWQTAMDQFKATAERSLPQRKEKRR
jgi:DNA-binding transcriptional ArsR family regulator